MTTVKKTREALLKKLNWKIKQPWWLSLWFSALGNKALWFEHYTHRSITILYFNPVTEVCQHCKMIERPAQGEVGSILVIASLIEPETGVKAPICMRRVHSSWGKLKLRTEKKNVNDNKQDESRQCWQQHPVEVLPWRKSHRRVIKHRHAQAHSKWNNRFNLEKFNYHWQDRNFKCEMTNAGIGPVKWLCQKWVLCSLTLSELSALPSQWLWQK